MPRPAFTLSKDLLLERRHVSASGCWEWTGGRQFSGYGRVKVRGHIHRVHRLAAHLWLEMPLNSADYVCHHCDNKICFNPAHLYLGDNKQNQLDALMRGQLPIGEDAHQAKVSNKEVEQIRSLRNTGHTLQYIAAKFGIGTSQVHRITTGKSRIGVKDAYAK